MGLTHVLSMRNMPRHRENSNICFSMGFSHLAGGWPTPYPPKHLFRRSKPNEKGLKFTRAIRGHMLFNIISAHCASFREPRGKKRKSILSSLACWPVHSPRPNVPTQIPLQPTKTTEDKNANRIKHMFRHRSNTVSIYCAHVRDLSNILCFVFKFFTAGLLAGPLSTRPPGRRGIWVAALNISARCHCVSIMFPRC